MSLVAYFTSFVFHTCQVSARTGRWRGPRIKLRRRKTEETEGKRRFRRSGSKELTETEVTRESAFERYIPARLYTHILQTVNLSHLATVYLLPSYVRLVPVLGAEGRCHKVSRGLYLRFYEQEHLIVTRSRLPSKNTLPRILRLICSSRAPSMVILLIDKGSCPHPREGGKARARPCSSMAGEPGSWA